MSSDASWQKLSLKNAGVSLIDCDHRTPPAADTGYPYIAIPQIKNGHIQLDGVRKISPEHYAEWTRKLKPQANDVIVVRRCNSGDSALVPRGLECAIGQNLVVLRSDGKRVIPEFLRWLVSGPDWWEQVRKFINVGAVFDSLKCREIPHFELTIPPINAQRKITTLLGALDDRIALLRETNATLEAIAQAMFKSWFIDFDPVHAKQQGISPEGMDETTAALFPDSFEESELGLVPRGWKVHSLGDLLVPKRGKSITKSKCTDGGIPVVAGGLEPAYFHNQSNVCSPVVTISASGANAGFVRLYQQDIWASDCSFFSTEQTDTTFFWYAFLRFKQENIYSMQQGAAQPHISPSDLMRLSICSPKSSVIRNFYNLLVSPLFERIGLANSTIQTLSNLRDTLLPRLISGQLRLPEAEAVLEEIEA
jgi:type I restriction enzyme S subunit